jgi:hypothetical protein
MTDLEYEHRGYSPRAARRVRAGKKAIVALTGLAALGAGALFFVTTAMPAKDQIAKNAGGLHPGRSASSSPHESARSPYRHPARKPARSATPAVSTPVKSGIAPQRSPVPLTSPSLTILQRLAVAQQVAGGLAVPSAVPRQSGSVADVPTDVTVTDSGSMSRDGSTLRLVSALGNLSGERELAWVADQGQPVGTSHCSQNFHYSAGVPAGENPALTVCWRISSEKSVIAVAVSNRGRPSAETAVAAIDRRWESLDPTPMPSF